MKKKFGVVVLTLLLLLCSACGKKAQTYDLYHEIERIDDNYRNYYEIFVGSFADGNADGWGDLPGLISKLDYLNDGDDATRDDLGITGIWLMPIQSSPTYHKYDTTDYYTVDPKYGTNDDFKRLAEECDKRGIKLIIDLVLNHTSSEHPWFKNACRALRDNTESPYTEYYNFSSTMQSGWERVLGTDLYYECKFWSEMPDLNMDCPALREEVVRIARHWLELGADGFRLDAAKWVYEDASKDNAFWQWFGEEVKKIDPDAYLVGEVYASDGVINEYYNSQLDSLFAFGVSDATGYAASTINRASYDGLGWATYNENAIAAMKAANSSGIYAPFLSNHDQGRIMGSLRNDLTRAKMAASLYLMLPGNPYIYYGEEIGMISSGDKDENKRTAFLWDTTGNCYSPSGADHFEQICQPVSAQKNDGNSLLSHYRHLLRLRDENPEIARGEMRAIDLGNASLSAYSVTYNGKTVYIVHNIGKEQAGTLQVATDRLANTLYGYATVSGEIPTLSDGQLTLPAYATVILR